MPDIPLDTTSTLTAKEQALFELLTRNRGRLYSRSEILERVWGLDFGGDERIVDAYVKRVRRKISEDAIETVRGAGYRRPSVPDQRQSLPHFRHLSADARTILDLGRRVLHANTVAGVLLEVEAVLAESLGVSGVALLTNSAAGAWEVQSACGDPHFDWVGLPPLHANLPEYQQVGELGGIDSNVAQANATLFGLTVAGRPAHSGAAAGGSGRPGTFALLPLAGPELTWGTLAVAAGTGTVWTATEYAQLEAVAALVNPALRLTMEMGFRQQAERELRDLNARLEYGVLQRTQHLLQAKQQAESLNLLSRQMEKARSVQELLSVSLPVMAKLAGTSACAAWLPSTGGALACFRADGTFSTSPALPERQGSEAGYRAGNELLVVSEVSGEEFVVHAFNDSSEAISSREVSPLLESATQSLALMLSRHLQIAALERTALTDEFTGLGNRQAFLTDLAGEVAFSARHQTGFVLGLVEIANIRFLNATAGYAGGNDSIALLATALAELGRAEDRAYRLNGATFALLMRLPPVPPLRLVKEAETDTQATFAVEGWRNRRAQQLGALVRSSPSPLNLQVSDVLCPEQARTPSDLLRRALDTLAPLPHDFVGFAERGNHG